MGTTDGFADMVDAAAAFFKQLDANNAKDWFEPRKDHYVKAIRQPAELLGELVADQIRQLTGVGHEAKVFRIHRDVRFSKDKRPYNAHLHISWSPSSGGEAAPGWFFACSPHMLTVNMGIPMLKGEALARYRAMVDRVGDELADQLQRVDLPFSAWGDEPLKKVPSPYPADHPHSELLKRRGLVLDAPLGAAWRDRPGGLLGAIDDRMTQMKPIWDLLNDHMADR